MLLFVGGQKRQLHPSREYWFRLHKLVDGTTAWYNRNLQRSETGLVVNPTRIMYAFATRLPDSRIVGAHTSFTTLARKLPVTFREF